MSFVNIHIVYFIGIGGIGMSALARWFHRKGCKVFGYDRTPSALTQELVAEGMTITYTDDVAQLPRELHRYKDKAMVIYTPAVPADHSQLSWLRQNDYQVVKRAEVLGMLTEEYFTIAVAGTHGKTTTSSIIAHIMKHAGRNMLAFLGGIATNYNNNLVFGLNETEALRLVVEADEFDRSFLALSPDLTVVTSADADHLDVYSNLEDMHNTYARFIERTSAQGKVFIHSSVAPHLLERSGYAGEAVHYAVNDGHVFAKNIHVKEGRFCFDLEYDGEHFEGFKLAIAGRHNIENALAAIAVALEVGLGVTAVREGINSYQGVKRRFETVLEQPGLVFIDDYAHHPRELEALLTAAKELHPGKRCTVIFQPHLFTRTRDFAQGFATSLQLADEVVLLDIYPARELPIPGVTAKTIYDLIGAGTHKVLCAKEELPQVVYDLNPELLITAGAGDIDRLVQPLARMFEPEQAENDDAHIQKV